MGRREDNIKIKSIIRTLLITSNGKKWTANQLLDFINFNDYKISINMNKHTIHNVIKMDKVGKGMLSDVEYEMVKNTKYYYIKKK